MHPTDYNVHELSKPSHGFYCKHIVFFWVVSAVFLISPFKAGAQELQGTDILEKLVERREQVKTWLSICDDPKGQYSELTNRCAQGDVTLFAGLGCLAATLSQDEQTIRDRCGDVEKAQGTDGRWWRGPTRVGDEDFNTFSRDMSRGALAFLIARGYVEQDQGARASARDAATHWLQWIMNEGQGRMCLKTRDGNNLCDITLGVHSLFYYVYQSLKVLPSPDNRERRVGGLIDDIRRSVDYPWMFLPIESAFAPLGYPAHLKAASILILRSADPRFIAPYKEMLDGSAETLYLREPENPLFEFLARGITPVAFETVMKRCPGTRPHPENPHRDFQWQRDVEDRAWERSDGHDCVFMLNLMIARMNGKLNW